MKVAIDPKEHERWVSLQQELASCGYHTNAAILQMLAVQYRKEEQVDTVDDYKTKKEATVAADRPGGIEQSLWRLRFSRAKTVQKVTLDEFADDVNLMTRFVKRKYEDEPREERKAAPVTLADNVQELLMKLTSTFNDQINDAMHSDATSPKISVQQNNPLSAILQLQAIEQNMKAIDHDMAILEQNKVHNEGDIGELLVGFGCAGDDDEESESADDDDDSSDDSNSDDDSNSSKESASDSDSDDDDSLMQEMAKEMGIIVPEGMNLADLLADSDSEGPSDDDDDLDSDDDSDSDNANDSLSEEDNSSDGDDSDLDEEEEELLRQMLAEHGTVARAAATKAISPVAAAPEAVIAQPQTLQGMAVLVPVPKPVVSPIPTMQQTSMTPLSPPIVTQLDDDKANHSDSDSSARDSEEDNGSDSNDDVFLSWPQNDVGADLDPSMKESSESDQASPLAVLPLPVKSTPMGKIRAALNLQVSKNCKVLQDKDDTSQRSRITEIGDSKSVPIEDSMQEAQILLFGQTDGPTTSSQQLCEVDFTRPGDIICGWDDDDYDDIESSDGLLVAWGDERFILEDICAERTEAKRAGDAEHEASLTAANDELAGGEQSATMVETHTGFHISMNRHDKSHIAHNLYVPPPHVAVETPITKGPKKKKGKCTRKKDEDEGSIKFSFTPVETATTGSIPTLKSLAFRQSFYEKKKNDRHKRNKNKHLDHEEASIATFERAKKLASKKRALKNEFVQGLCVLAPGKGRAIGSTMA